jgi:hypothetical protein
LTKGRLAFRKIVHLFEEKVFCVREITIHDSP